MSRVQRNNAPMRWRQHNSGLFDALDKTITAVQWRQRRGAPYSEGLGIKPANCVGA